MSSICWVGVMIFLLFYGKVAQRRLKITWSNHVATDRSLWSSAHDWIGGSGWWVIHLWEEPIDTKVRRKCVCVYVYMLFSYNITSTYYTHRHTHTFILMHTRQLEVVRYWLSGYPQKKHLPSIVKKLLIPELKLKINNIFSFLSILFGSLIFNPTLFCSKLNPLSADP